MKNYLKNENENPKKVMKAFPSTNINMLSANYKYYVLKIHIYDFFENEKKNQMFFCFMKIIFQNEIKRNTNRKNFF